MFRKMLKLSFRIPYYYLKHEKSNEHILLSGSEAEPFQINLTKVTPTHGLNTWVFCDIR